MDGARRTPAVTVAGLLDERARLVGVVLVGLLGVAEPWVALVGHAGAGHAGVAQEVLADPDAINRVIGGLAQELVVPRGFVQAQGMAPVVRIWPGDDLEALGLQRGDG